MLIDTIAIVVPGGAGTAVPAKSCQLPRDASGRVFGGILITKPSPRKLKNALKYEIVIVVKYTCSLTLYDRWLCLVLSSVKDLGQREFVTVEPAVCRVLEAAKHLISLRNPVICKNKNPGQISAFGLDFFNGF